MFYKARRNVPGGNGNKEEKRCEVASCWYGYIYLRFQVIYSFDDDPVQKFRVQRIITVTVCASSYMGSSRQGFRIVYLLHFADDVILNLRELFGKDQDSRTVAARGSIGPPYTRLCLCGL